MNLRGVKLAGRTIRVNDRQPTFWDRVEAGSWEPGTLLALGALIRPGTAFLDIGAWVGPTALYAAALGARVVAVEADPAALEQLGANLAANPDLAERVTVVPRAAHPVLGRVALGVRRKPGDSMGSVLLAGRAGGWEAQAATPEDLAAMLAEEAVVKIDIEGGEYALLPALGPVLARAGAVLVSFHPGILAEAEGDPRERERLLAGALAALAGFEPCPITSSGIGAPAEPAPGGRLSAEEWAFLRRRGDAQDASRSGS